MSFHFFALDHLITLVIDLLTQATRDLESRIGKTADTYTSGISALKELSEMLQKKASSDLEKMNSSMASQIETVEQVWTR